MGEHKHKQFISSYNSQANQIYTYTVSYIVQIDSELKYTQFIYFLLYFILIIN